MNQSLHITKDRFAQIILNYVISSALDVNNKSCLQLWEGTDISACSKVLVPVKIFQFHDMHYESERYRDAANGLSVTAQNRKKPKHA